MFLIMICRLSVKGDTVRIEAEKNALGLWCAKMTDEQRERMQKSGMGVGMGGINSGEEKLFGMRLYEPAPSCAPSRRGAPCRAWRGRARCGGDHLCACCLSRHAAPTIRQLVGGQFVSGRDGGRRPAPI